jgi:hypothetical protein
MIDKETHKDIKFYLCVILGFILMMIGAYIPPEGILDSSMLYGSSFFLILAGCVEGLDIKGIIRELRMLKTTCPTNTEQNKIIDDLTKKEGE